MRLENKVAFISGGARGMGAYPTPDSSVAPLRTEGDSWDVAYAALFLCSDEADFIDGVLHASFFIYLDPVGLHLEVLFDVFHHFVAVVDQNPDVMHEFEHVAS